AAHRLRHTGDWSHRSEGKAVPVAVGDAARDLLRVDDAHKAVRVASIDRYAGEGSLREAFTYLRDRRVFRDGDDVDARDHDAANGEDTEAQGALKASLLRFGEHPALATLSDEQGDLTRRVDVAVPGRRSPQ